MKTSIKKVVLAVLIFLVHIFIPTNLKAQNPLNSSFYIYNHRNCDITVHYEFSDCIGDAVCGGAGVYDSNPALVIPANTSVSFVSVIQNPVPYVPSPSCPWLGGDVFVWLKEINGVDVTGGSNSQSVGAGNCITVNSPTGTGTLPTSISPPCNTPGTYLVIFSPAGVDIW